MISLPHIYVRTYGGLEVRAVDPSSMSGSGGTPKKKAPVKCPGKTPKKK